MVVVVVTVTVVMAVTMTMISMRMIFGIPMSEVAASPGNGSMPKGSWQRWLIL